MPVFPKPTCDDVETIVLKGAIQQACAELIEVHGIEGEELASLFEVIAQAILEDFRRGCRDTSVLGQYAAVKALAHLGRQLQSH